jgi:hypothetical protein
MGYKTKDNMADNKVFDVAHPKNISEPAEEPKQARKIILNAPGAADLSEPATTDSQEIVSHKAQKIEPISEAKSEEPEQEPTKEPELASKDVIEEPEEGAANYEKSEDPEQKDTTSNEEPKDEDKPVNTEPFAASDSLPDASEKAAASTKEVMQEPKIFDTKEYYVPIGDAHHAHGHGRTSLLVGLLVAAIVVGVAVFYMYSIGS